MLALRKIWTRSNLTALAGVFALSALAILATSAPALASSEDNLNDIEYWENLYPDATECFKYDPPGTTNVHGYLTNDGLSVTLYPFDSSWSGDHWEVLIVKGGASGGYLDSGNAVYPHPSSGVDYYAPLNAGGQQPEVSHWIVCLGADSSPTPSETPSETPSPTPSETVSPTESPSPTPSETPSETPSPTPSETVSPTESPSPTESILPTSDPTPTPSESILAETGTSDDWARSAGIAITLLIAGLVLMWVRPPATEQF